MTSARKTPDGQKRQNNSVRFVRTREGERRYGKPIGSVIVSDTDMENIKHLGNHKGWGVFRGKNGKKYQVGKVDGLWVATPFGDFTRRRSLVEGGDLQATLKALNRRAGNKAERREDTQYDRQKRAGKRGTVTGRSTAKEKAPTRRKRGTTTSSKRSTSRSSRGAGSKAPAKKITKKKGDYTGANLQGLRRLVSAAFGTASSGAERSAASKVMAELEKQGLVKRTKVKGKIQWRPVDGYSASDVVAGATESEKIDSIMFELQKSEEKAMQVAERIEHRANVMFAELKGLTLHDGSVESLEQKDMQEDMEEKVRRVRTPAGVRRFKKPIGSIIGRGGKVFQNITIEDPVFDGWDLVKDKKGKKYDVGREGGKWQAYGHNDWDDLVAEADSEDDLYEALDRRAGGAKKPVPAKKPSASAKKVQEANQKIAADREARKKAKIAATRQNIAIGNQSAQKIYDSLPADQQAEVDALDDEGKKKYFAVRKGSARFPQITDHRNAMEAVKRNERMALARNTSNLIRTHDDRTKKIRPSLPAYKKNTTEQIRADLLNLRAAVDDLTGIINGDVASERQKASAELVLDRTRSKLKAVEIAYSASTDHTGGKRNERSKRPINVRTADDEEREAQSDDRAPEDIGRHERVANRRPKTRAEGRAKARAERTPDDGGESESRLANLNASQRRAYDALPTRAQTMYVSHLAAGGSPASALKTAKENYKKMLERAAKDPEYAKRFGLPTSGKAQGVLF